MGVDIMIRKVMIGLVVFLCFMMVLNVASAAIANHVVISEVQTGSSLRANDDFIELYNPKDTPYNLNGHRLVKRTASGIADINLKSWTTDTFIPAHGFYLWANNGYTTIITNPDTTTGSIIANNNGIALRNGSLDTGIIIDSVAWGASTNAFIEGSVFATNPPLDLSIERKSAPTHNPSEGNAWDTQDNSADFFETTSLNPQNSSSSTEWDTTAPSQQTAVNVQNPINIANQAVVQVTGDAAGEDDGSMVNCSIDDIAGNGPFIDNGIVSSNAFDITFDVSTLDDGTITAICVVTDLVGNVGTNQDGSATKDTVLPTLSPVTISTTNANPLYAKIGDVVTVTFTASEALQSNPLVNIDGNVYVSVPTGNPLEYSASRTMVSGDTEAVIAFTINFADAAGNAGIPAFTTTDLSSVTFDETAPAGYTAAFDQAYVNSANQNSISFTFAGAETQTTYYYEIEDVTPGAPVTGTGTITAPGQIISGINTASLSDGSLNLKVYLTDAAGNQGTDATDTIDKDVVAPTISETTPVATPTNDNTPDYTFNSNEAGAIAYVGCPSAAASAVTGNNPITLDLLADGTYNACTIQVTDTAGNPSNVLTMSSFRIDTVLPTVTNIAVTDNLVTEADTGSIFTVQINYSENMDTGINPAVAFTPAVASTLTGCAGSWYDADTYEYDCTVADADFEQDDVDVDVSGAEDLAGNTQTADSLADAFDVDTIKPDVATITLNDYSVIETDAGVDNFVITINYDEDMDQTPGEEPVTTFSAIVSTTFTNCAGAWTDTDEYTYTCDIEDDNFAQDDIDVYVNGAQDLAGNPQTAGSSLAVLDIDTIAPYTTSATAVPDPAKDGGVIITVIFSENMNISVSPTVQVTGLTGSPYAVGQTSYAGNTWTGAFTLADDDEDTTGTISVSLAQDIPGNVMVAEPSAGTFNADSLNPTVNGFSISDLLINEADTGSSFVIQINYSENMDTGINPAVAFTPAVASTLTGCAGSWYDADTYEYDCTVADANVEVDDVDITVTLAQDIPGNIQVAYNSPDAFDIDTVKPTTTSIFVNDASIIETDAGIDSFTVTVDYSETMNTGINPAITFVPAVATTLTNCDGIWNTNQQYILTCDIEDDNQDIENVDIIVNSAQDVAGNTQTSGSLADAFDIDTIAPTVISLTITDNMISEADAGDTFTVTIDYSEDMDGTINPAVAFTPAVASTLTGCAGSWYDADTYEYDCTVADANVEVDDVDITVTLAQDIPGNVQVAYNSPDAFDIDTFITVITTYTPYEQDHDGQINNDDNVVLNATISDTNSITQVIVSGTWQDGTWRNYTVTSPGNNIYPYVIDQQYLENQEIVSWRYYAYDGFGNTQESPAQQFTVNNRPPVNDAAIPSMQWDENANGNTSNMLDHFTDPDGDVLTYTEAPITTDSPGIRVSFTGDTAYFTSDLRACGTEIFRITAADPYSGTVQSNSVTINVICKNNPPDKIKDFPPIEILEDTSSAPIDLTQYFWDSDGYIESYSFDRYFHADNLTATFNGNWMTITAFNNGTGFGQLNIIAYDNQTGVERGIVGNMINITVTPFNDQPYTIGTPEQINLTESLTPGDTAGTIDLTQYFGDVETPASQLLYTIISENENQVDCSITGSILSYMPKQYWHTTPAIPLASCVVTANDTEKVSPTQTFNFKINSTENLPVFTNTCGSTAQEDILYECDLNVLDGDVVNGEQTMTFSFVEDNMDRPVNMYINPQTGLISWIPANDRVGLNHVIVMVMDSASPKNNATYEFDITVSNDNDRPTQPVLISPANGASVENAQKTALLEWQYSIDPDGNPITYYVYLGNSSDQPLLISTSGNNTLTPILDNETVYYWYVVARDSLNADSIKSATWTFTTDFDHVPEIIEVDPETNPAIGETESVRLRARLQDVDNDLITFTWFVDGEQVRTGATTQTPIQWIGYNFVTDYDSTGTHNVRLEIVDSNNNQGVPHEWTVYVNDLNRVPTINPVSSQNAIEDSELQFNISGSDEDGDSLTFSSDVEGISFTRVNRTHALGRWTPTNENVGPNTVTFTVNDGRGGTAQTTAVITVANTNDAPIITGFTPEYNPVIPDLTGSQQFSITAEDPDSDPLTYTWYRDGTQVYTGVNYLVSSLEAGVYTIRCRVSDGIENASHSWTLTASDHPISSLYTGTILTQEDYANAANVTIIRSGYGSIVFDESIVMDLSDVVDIDNHVTIDRGIAGIDTGFYPQMNRPATITLTGLRYGEEPIIYYNDGYSTTGSAHCPPAVCTGINYDLASGILTFNVTQIGMFWTTGNQRPLITSTANTKATLFKQYKYQVIVDDPDNDPITYSLTGPAGMAISSSGLVTWTPNTDDAVGTHSISITASDGVFSDQQDYDLIVVENRLFINKVDVDVDGDTDKDVLEGETVKEKAKPESEIEFKIEVENLFSDEQDLDIENIVVRVEIYDIDDGSDLEEESDEFDLKQGKDEKVSLNFNVPLEVEEDTYEVLITVEGEDENGTDHEMTQTIYLEVEKEKHDIRVRRAYLNPSSLSCGGTANLDVSIMNLGKEDEDEVVLEISSPQLRINERVDEIELDAGTNDDNTYSSSFSFDVDEDIAAGNYPITIKTYYSETRESGSEIVNFLVEECSKKKDEIVMPEITWQVIDDTISESEKQAAPPAATTQITFKESPAYMALLGLAYILIIGLGTVMVLYWLKIRKE